MAIMRALWLTLTLCVAVCAGRNVYRTRGLSSHTPCGGMYCLWREAVCNASSQVCDCRTGGGLGAISCSKTASTNGGLFTEPSTAPSKFHFMTVHSPCRYLLAHVESNMMENGKSLGVCDIKMHAWERRSKGRWYIAGTDLTVNMKTIEGEEKQETVRWQAGGRRGVYSWQVDPTVDFASKNWGSRPCMDLAVDGSNNRARVLVKACGFHMAFRPMDTRLVNQTHLPGLNFDADHSFLPAWMSQDTALLVPPPDSQHKEYNVLTLPFWSDKTLMERVFAAGVKQGGPGTPRSCLAAQTAALQCPKASRARAFESCDVILTSGCYRGDSRLAMGRIVTLYTSCLKAVCSRDTVMCESVLTQLHTRCVTPHVTLQCDTL